MKTYTLYAAVLLAIASSVNASDNHGSPQFALEIKDNRLMRRFEIMLKSRDTRPICIPLGYWPDILGQIGDKGAILISGRKRLSSKPTDEGYSESDTSDAWKIPPHGELRGFIGYDQFGEANYIASLRTKKLLFSIPEAHICGQPW